MELWIRNQDKTLLAKVDRIVLEDFDNSKPRIYSNDDFLGEYETKERALEVLDEIQDKIVINYGYELSTNSGIRPDNIEPKGCYTAVYEMPLD